MKKTLLLCFTVLFSSLVLGNPKYVEQAEKQAHNWMDTIDKGDAESSWNEMSSIFTQQLSAEDWKLSIQGMQMYFGKVGQRKIKSSNYKTSSYGAPNGDYVDVEFSTDYANAAGRKEVVTMVRDQDGQWKVAGFSIE